jgi:hypothetical protein
VPRPGSHEPERNSLPSQRVAAVAVGSVIVSPSVSVW